MMKGRKRMKIPTKSIDLAIALLALTSLTLLPKMQAVNPPPDGGYPNFTTAEGTNALQNLSSGAANTALGWYSLFTDSTGSFNTGVGAGALALNNGDSNTAVGTAALLLNTSGPFNTAVGTAALVHNDNGGNNTAVGAFALNGNNGGSNTATGVNALVSNSVGGNNTATGVNALATNSTGNSNVAIGDGALDHNTTGSFNTAIGRLAGTDVTQGSGNVYIGAAVTGASDENFHTYIANIEMTSVSGGGADTVTVDLSTGLLGHLSSSRRYKEHIQPMDAGSETLYRLKPVTFRYKKEIDATQSLDYGLVAEDVANIDPNLANRNRDGQIESVRYNAINAMLLNEFLKEHKKVEELQATVARQQERFAQQQKQIEALAAGLQKMSTGLEMTKAATQVAAKNQ
jgi:hypothetical protein